MARLTRDERRLQELERVQQDVEANKTFAVRALRILANAEKLGLNYTVAFNVEKSAVDVQVKASVEDLGYKEDSVARVWFNPNEFNYTNPWCFTDLETLVERVETHKIEKQRLADVKERALDKLTDEEKSVLGLLPNKRENFR